MIFTILAALVIQGQSKSVEPEAKRIYQYLDSLNCGFLGKPLVEVTTGGNRSKYVGFLMTTGRNFQVLGLHLTEVRTRESSDEVMGFPSATYRVLDQKSWLHEYAIKALHPNRPDLLPPYSNIGTGYEPPQDIATIAVIARVIANRGDTATASQLISKVISEAVTHEILGEQLGQYASRQILEDISNTTVSREHLLLEVRQCLHRYPEIGDRKIIEEVADQIGASVAKRRAHVKPNPAKATRAQMIAEWIYELENVDGEVFAHPSEFSVYWPSREASSVKDLTSAGFDAVPALIQALEDRRFTYALGDAMRGIGPGILVRVRDCAAQILSRISGQEFWPQGCQTIDDATAASIKKEASRWFTLARKVGEVATLEHQLTGRQPYVETRLSRLGVIAPKRVLRVVRADHLDRGRDLLVALPIVDRLGIPEGQNFVRKTMVDGPDRESRLLAASLLSRYDEHAAIAAMIAELDHKVPKLKADGSDFDVNLYLFLMHCGHENAIRAVAARINIQNMWLSVWLLASLTSHREGFILEDPKFLGDLNRRTPVDRAAASRALEDLCAKKLEDTRSTIGGGKFVKEFQFLVPRISDYAALALAQLFPSVYHYFEPTSEAKSEALRIENLNIYRRRQGLSLVHAVLYEPLMRPSKNLKPALAAVTNRDAARRRAALQTLQTMGLPTLPLLLKKAEALAKNDPARADILTTARLIAMTVSGVKVWRATTAEQRQVQPRRGIPLTLPSLHAMIRRVRATPGAVLVLSRSADLSGVRFEFAYGHFGTVKSTSFNQNVLIGDGQAESPFSNTSSESGSTGDLEPEIRRLFSVDPRTPFRFEVSR